MLESLFLASWLPAKEPGDIALSWFEVGIAATMLAINAVVSLRLRLGLAKTIGWSALRMTLQLAILGLVLKQIFDIASAAPVLVLAGAMTIIAGVSAVRRIDHRYPSIYVTAISAVWISSWIWGSCS